MYRLFNRPLANYGTINTSQTINRLKDLLLQRLDYQNSLQSIAGNPLSGEHILIRLAHRLAPYMDHLDTYASVDDAIPNICNPLGITSEYGFGKIHYNMFYTEFNPIISTTFIDQFTDTHWRNIRAVRLLDHSFTSMELFIPPTRLSDIKKEKITVIGVDIPLFAHQLKEWLLHNNTVDETGKENLAEFISKYVLPGMVNEYIDIAIRNRLQYLALNEDMPYERHERSFVHGYEGIIERPLKSIISSIKYSNQTYLKGLEEIPFIFKDNYLKALPSEIESLNSYSYWVVFYVFTQWAYPITFLFDKEFGNGTNIKTILNRVDRLIQKRQYLGKMNELMEEDCLVKYKKIKEKFN